MFQGRQTFTVPAGAGTFAPERLYCRTDTPASDDATNAVKPSKRGLLDTVEALRVLVEGVLPATAVVVVELLKVGGTADLDADWIDSAITGIVQGLNPSGANASQPFWLAEWAGVRIRVKSGGTAGAVAISASWS